MSSDMNWIELGNPTPKSQPEAYSPLVWPEGRYRFFSPPGTVGSHRTVPNEPARSIFEILASRRSKRDFSPLENNDLSLLLWHSVATQANAPSTYGFDLEQRPAPSAGAIHPIHILVNLPDETTWARYDTHAHALVDVEGASVILHPLLAQFESLIPSQQTTRFLLVAEPGKSFAKYDYASSLIWRDAGALLATLGITAEALGLNFCPLGATGEPCASRLAPQDRLSGVGLAVVGRRPR